MQDLLTGAKHILTAAFSQPPKLDPQMTLALDAAARRAAPSEAVGKPAPR